MKLVCTKITYKFSGTKKNGVKLTPAPHHKLQLSGYNKISFYWVWEAKLFSKASTYHYRQC